MGNSPYAGNEPLHVVAIDVILTAEVGLQFLFFVMYSAMESEEKDDQGEKEREPRLEEERSARIGQKCAEVTGMTHICIGACFDDRLVIPDGDMPGKEAAERENGPGADRQTGQHHDKRNGRDRAPV